MSLTKHKKQEMHVCNIKAWIELIKLTSKPFIPNVNKIFTWNVLQDGNYGCLRWKGHNLTTYTMQLTLWHLTSCNVMFKTQTHIDDDHLTASVCSSHSKSGLPHITSGI